MNTTRHDANGLRPSITGRGTARNARGRLGIDSQVSARRTHLILPERLTVDSWRHIGEQISCIAQASAWWLGDWLIYGQDKYPDRYKRAMLGTSLDYQTLKNYAWVARRFEPSRRRDRLSFQHHVEVAALPLTEQDSWLTRAEEFGWSRNELRRQLRSQIEGPSQGRDQRPDVLLQLAFNKQHIDSWQAAADKVGVSFSDWVRAVLDDASAMILDGNSGLPIDGLPIDEFI